MGSYGSYIKQTEDPYKETKTLEVTPEQKTRTTYLGAPDPAAMQEVEGRVIAPLQKAYGINPETGAVTPFEVIGYNPAEERKRREAERRLNDFKRKENAWYNAFSVVGDTLTAALGGNVWQRQPNRIGAQALANNERLIQEQKAEDMNNAALVRDAGARYAHEVNKVLQPYFSKVTTTGKVGGSRKEITEGTKKNTNVLRWGKTGDSGSGSGSGGGSGSSKTVLIQMRDKNGNIYSEDFHIPANDFDAIGRYLSAAYNNLDNAGKKNIADVLAKHNIFPRDNGSGKNTYDGADLLSSGIVFDDPQIRREFVKIIQNDGSRTKEEKERIIKAMNEYPSAAGEEPTPEKKRSWWQRLKDWFNKTTTPAQQQAAPSITWPGVTQPAQPATTWPGVNNDDETYDD